MSEKRDEKSLSFDDFKERVYKNIGTLEIVDDKYYDEVTRETNKGCLGFLVTPFVGKLVRRASTETRKDKKIDELSVKADEFLAKKEIRELLCENLDATVRLPIDAAFKLTPVLYGLASKGLHKVPFDSMFFAIVCRKVADQGVESFCS